jgi:hypothetical protein
MDEQPLRTVAAPADVKKALRDGRAAQCSSVAVATFLLPGSVQPPAKRSGEPLAQSLGMKLVANGDVAF